ncbi:MAG: glycoside hydrolase family 5 protein [Cytophagaceae bacterium]
MLRNNIFLLVIIICISFTSAFSQNNSFVSVKGKEIIGRDGKPLIIRGTNVGNWLVPEGYMFKLSKTYSSPTNINILFSQIIGPEDTKKFWRRFLDEYITYEDVKYMKSLGMNTIRVPFHYKLFTQDEYMGSANSNEGFMLLDRIIGWCKKEGLYVILDMHCAPGGQTGDNIDDSYGYPWLYESPELKNLTIDIWKKIAEYYRNDETVMGYDLLNEPIAHYFDASKLNPYLEPLYKDIVKAIREKDNNHLIFLGGAQWNTNFDVFGTPFDNKLVYTFHLYWCDTTQKVIEKFVAFRDKYNVPIYIGETGENTDEWVKSFRILLERNNIGWTYWPYKKLENKKGIVDFNFPENYDMIIKYSEVASLNYEEIRKNCPTDREKIKIALDGFIENCKYKNCRPNAGYIKALGLKAE